MFKLKAKVTKNRFPQIKGAIRREIVKVVNDTVEEAFAISQDLVPVAEGDLKASGEIENYNGGEIKKLSYGTDHCFYVEFGTSEMEAQPFLRPAVAAVKSRLNRRLGQIKAGLGRGIG